MTHTETEYTTLPEQLRKRRQWVVWSRDPDGTKIPRQNNGKKAKVNDPATWTTFAEAVAAADQFDGIGFVITADDPYCGVDLDNCLQRDQLRSWAIPIIAKLVSIGYGEISPSGTGIKFLTHADKTERSGNVHKFGPDKQQIEVYDGTNRKTGKPGHRWWAMTSDLYGAADTIGFGQAAIESICRDYLMPTTRTPPKDRNGSAKTSTSRDANVLERAAKYLAKMDAAVSGERGHDKCYAAACAMVIGFDLDSDQAFQLLRDEYNPRCVPPWTEQELRHKVDDANAEAGPRGNLRDARSTPSMNKIVDRIIQAADIPPPPNLPPGWIGEVEKQTDNFLSRIFIDAYGKKLRYVPKWRKWLVWDGRLWVTDPDNSRVALLVRRFTHNLWSQFPVLAKTLTPKDLTKLITLIRSKNSGQGIKAIISLARADNRVMVDPDQLNANPYLLNLANGTFDLTSGEFLAHDAGNLLTVIANVAYGETAECPEWDKTMRLVFGGDQDLIAYVHQIFGYALTGDTGEHILPIAYGSGANGKSTVWNTIVDLLGDYACVASESLLLGRKDEHDTIKAALFGKRLVVISEPDQGVPLREARMKELTGDTFITARRMKEDPWTFRRTHTFFMATNHLPRISGTDAGVWRRIKKIPFERDLRKIDGLEVKPDFHNWMVKNEGPGILNRLIDGYAAYVANGRKFSEPITVVNATEEYRIDEDPLAEFVTDRIVETDDLATQLVSSAVHAAYLSWAESNGIKKPYGKNKFADLMTTKFKRRRATSGTHKGKFCYYGISIKE